MDFITLALARGYINAQVKKIGSSIESIEATSTGIKFVTKDGNFEVNIQDWNTFSNEDKQKLMSIESGAQKNQNAFSVVGVNGANLVAQNTEDKVTFKSGQGIKLVPNEFSNTVTISSDVSLDNLNINYEKLTNKPKINDVELVGSLSANQLGFAPVSTSGKYADLIGKPLIPTATSQLVNDSSYITTDTNMLQNYYTKLETYSSDDIDALISGITALSYKIVTTLPTTGESNVVYLVQYDTNKYSQYLYIGEWISLGDFTGNFEGYATEQFVKDGFVAKVAGKELSTNDFTDADKQKITSLENSLKNDYTPTSELTNEFVVREAGKQLSTNDFTNQDKSKLDTLENYTLPVATTSVLGGVKPDGTTILISDDGTLTALGGSGSGGGTTNYNLLVNKPKISGIELLGNLSLSDLGVSGVGLTGNYDDLINKPIVANKTSELVNDTGFITNTVDNLLNYYSKSNTLNKDEINQLISSLSSFTVEIVTSLPTSNISTTTIYLMKDTVSDFYVQYLYINSQWETIGSTDINLSNYYTKSESDNKFVIKETGKGLSENNFTNNDKNKLDSLSSYTLPVATVTTIGGVKPDNTTIKIDTDGTIKAIVSGSSGSSDYNQLENKPKINNIVLEGSLTSDTLGLASTEFVIAEIQKAIGDTLKGAY